MSGAAAAPSPTAPDVPIDRRAILVLAGGHASVDVAQGAVPALLPFLIHARGYSYGAAPAAAVPAG